MSPRKGWLLNILIFCCTTAVALAAGEAVLRAGIPSAQRHGYYVWPPNFRTVLKPSPDIMPGVRDHANFVTNSLGMRAPEPAPQANYRILALGGSTTICDYLDQSEAWPQLLQDNLNEQSQSWQVWVGNVGLSGLTSRHHIVALERLPLQELDVDAVILLMGVNDLSRRLAHHDDYDPQFLAKPEAKRQLLAETFTGTFGLYGNAPFYRRTLMWQMLSRTRRSLLNTRVTQDAYGRNFITWRQHRQSAVELREELPDLSSALQEYWRNVNRLVDISQEKAVRLILLTQPTMWKLGLRKELEALLWLGGIGDFQNEDGKSYYSAAALDKGMRAYNDVLLQVCHERNVECVDLPPTLAKDTTVFYDDIHFNEAGAQRVAKILAAQLLQRVLGQVPQVTEQHQ